MRLKKSLISRNAKNRTVHCLGGRIASAAGNTPVFRRVEMEHAWVRAGVSGVNWLFSLFSCNIVVLEGMDYCSHKFTLSLLGGLVSTSRSVILMNKKNA